MTPSRLEVMERLVAWQGPYALWWLLEAMLVADEGAAC